MSWVTEVLLNVGFENVERIADVNRFFEYEEEDGLVAVDSPDLPFHWYGGDMPFNRPVLVGSYNHLDVEGFIQHIKSLDLPNIHAVQLIIADEMGDFRFIPIV